MTTQLEQAMRLALDALEAHADIGIKSDKAITALRAALTDNALERKAENARELGLDYEQPAQDEPVAWMTINEYGEEDDIHYKNPEGELLAGWTYKPLYTRPQAREWVGLTFEDKKRVLDNDFGGNRADCMDAAEKILREKNT